MAHSLSAKKRVRQNAKHRARNRWRNERVRTARKQLLDLIQAGKADDALKALPGYHRLVDKIAATGTLHKNAASRLKARMTLKVNALKAAPAPQAA